ncbi:MAG: HD domain-containing protein [Clostridiales bacterium]|nr:HD domain-containing protein [Clostridiales bacterium]
MSERYNKALIFATNAHAGQTRKAGGLPYIIHPIEVSSIAATMTNDEDILIAALLHDVIEDAGVTGEELAEKFGERVAFLVKCESENKYPGVPEIETWQKRKEESLLCLKNTDNESVKILWVSDKLSNLRSLYRLYLKNGDAAFRFFNQQDKSKIKWYYSSVAQYTSSLSEETAHIELCELIKKVFE